MRQDKAMYEETFRAACCARLWKKEKQKWKKETKEEESKRGKKLEREEEKSVIKRRCVNPFSSTVFEEFCVVDEFKKCCGFWVFVCLLCLRMCSL